jgi:hypothetical protein
LKKCLKDFTKPSCLCASGTSLGTLFGGLQHESAAKAEVNVTLARAETLVKMHSHNKKRNSPSVPEQFFGN